MAKILRSTCYCTQCGEGFPILRNDSKIREPGHLKKLYCNTCLDYTNHAEVREFGKYTYNDFLIELNYNNFTKNGERIKPWKQFIKEYY